MINAFFFYSEFARVRSIAVTNVHNAMLKICPMIYASFLN